MKRARYTAHGALAIAAASWGLEFAICVGGVETAPYREIGTFAVVDIRGPLQQRGDFPWDSYERIRERVAAALESQQESLLLRIDSPGGDVAGCFELAEEIRDRAAAAGKPVVAYVDGMTASAAYALACSASRICIPPTGVVGSIGCIKMAVDQTRMDRALGLTFAVTSTGKRKADGNPHVPTSEESLAAMQAEVDAMAAVFFDLVARSRSTSAEAVAALEAGMFVGAAAVAAGLADEVTTFDALVAGAASSGAKTIAQSGAEEKMDEEKEKAIAALKALAESKDEAESKAAKAALKAMGVADGDDEDKDKDGDGDKSKSESDDDKKPDDDKKDKDGDDAAAKAAALAMAAQVQSLAAWKAQREESEERATLMATRQDLAPEVVDFLSRQPLKVVRDAVKTLPRGTAKGAKGNAVTAARAALTVDATRGDTQGEPQNALSEEAAHELDVKMGLAKPAQAIRHDGTRLILGVMTPAEARAELAKKGASK